MPNTMSSMPLPKNFNRFTVLSGAGPRSNNLASSFKLASNSKSSELHPLKRYNKTIIKSFNDPLVKRNIRRGGLSTKQQLKLFRKIVAKEEHLKTDMYAKKVLKNNLLKHFAHRPEVQARIKEQYSEDLKGGGKAVRTVNQYQSTGNTLGKKQNKTFPTGTTKLRVIFLWNFQAFMASFLTVEK